MVYRFFQFLDVTSPVLALVFAFIYFRKKERQIGRSDILIITYLFVQLFCNLSGNILQIFKTNNLFLYHLNCLLSLVVIQAYYHSLFIHKVTFRKAIFLSSCVFVVFFFVNILLLQPYNRFPSNSLALCALLITFTSMYFFRIWLADFSEYSLYDTREVWYSSGLLIYFASSFFVFLSYSYFSYFNVKTIPYLWRLHNIFLCVMCLAIAKGFSCKTSISKYSS